MQIRDLCASTPQQLVVQLVEQLRILRFYVGESWHQPQKDTGKKGRNPKFPIDLLY
jgi:hypothetical protein